MILVNILVNITRNNYVIKWFMKYMKSVSVRCNVNEFSMGHCCYILLKIFTYFATFFLNDTNNNCYFLF